MTGVDQTRSKCLPPSSAVPEKQIYEGHPIPSTGGARFASVGRGERERRRKVKMSFQLAMRSGKVELQVLPPAPGLDVFPGRSTECDAVEGEFQLGQLACHLLAFTRDVLSLGNSLSYRRSEPVSAETWCIGMT